MKKIFLLYCLFLQAAVGFSQTSAPTAKVALAAPSNKSMLQAVTAFMKSLSETQRQKATFPFEDEERFNWHFIPRDRKGVPLREMNDTQKKLALGIVQNALSNQGYGKVKAIMENEVLLKLIEKLPPENDRRDPGKYYFSVFGKPSKNEPWGWRVEGHHLSLNFSSVTGQVVAETPAFMGTNPAVVLDGPQKRNEILKEEADLGFALVHSLSPQQLQKAFIAEIAPNEMVTSNSRKVMLEQTEGIAFTDLTPEQQKLCTQLLNVYLDNYNKNLAKSLRAKVEKAGMDKLHFAWAGSRERVPTGKAHYYRLHNPAILIEYDNSQNDANHVHTVIRDLTDDFGEDALRVHYESHPHNK